jgi:malonyl-CoA/methylmalonyl-CoA synthetase
VLLHALPIFHIHGLFVAINVTLAAGSSLLFLPRFDVDLVLRHLPDASVMMGVPTFLRTLAQGCTAGPQARGALPAVHLRLRAAADRHAPPMVERTGHTLLERYGMSETGMNTSNPYAGERVPGSVGLPLPGVSLRIADVGGGNRHGGRSA